MRKTAFFISISIIILSFAFSFYFYPQLPGTIASHWNSEGVVNGTSSSLGIFFIPILLTFLFLLLIFLPKIDPMKKNIKDFSNVYDDFILVFNLFMFYTFSLTIVWNLGYSFNMTVGIMPGLSIMFYFLGTMIPKTKRNYTIGVRTPWALESNIVWEKTSKFSGALFKFIGLLCLFLMFFPEQSFILFFTALILLVPSIFVYSYLEYKKLKLEKKR
ncbi:MAG: SdpI family protein [Candidatus Paceibacterota bacterium]